MIGGDESDAGGDSGQPGRLHCDHRRRGSFATYPGPALAKRTIAWISTLASRGSTDNGGAGVLQETGDGRTRGRKNLSFPLYLSLSPKVIEGRRKLDLGRKSPIHRLQAGSCR
jgi:hypothetical protein